jgi:hypothetical protein
VVSISFPWRAARPTAAHPPREPAPGRRVPGDPRLALTLPLSLSLTVILGLLAGHQLAAWATGERGAPPPGIALRVSRAACGEPGRPEPVQLTLTLPAAVGRTVDDVAVTVGGQVVARTFFTGTRARASWSSPAPTAGQEVTVRGWGLGHRLLWQREARLRCP